MFFTTFSFQVFFISLALIYYLVPLKFRWVILLVASYLFYLNVKPVFTILLVLVTLTAYLFTMAMERTKSEPGRRALLIANIILILLPLFFFKYFGQINSSIISLFESIHGKWVIPELKLLLPIGISFYTFMAIGYSVDVYHEEIEAEKNFGILALFISFFPLILSGPIERAKNMLPQFRSLKAINYFMIIHGLKLMLWGYFMKLVVADRIGIYVNAIYNNIAMHNGTSILVATILYPFQVYADLGGYSLIAIGVANVLGINVMQNFNRPFFSGSMAEFWRRWHISLISWLTDYVYTPLSFSFRKIGVWGIVAALLITFIISGIWHGASLAFVVWGLMQGLFLSTEALLKKKRSAIEKKYRLCNKILYILFGILLTFILFTSSQVFGRAGDVNDAILIFRKIFTSSGALFIGNPSTFIFSIFGLLVLLAKDFVDEFIPSRVLLFENRSKAVRILAYSSVIIIILLIGVFDGGQFIYFQF
jgi:alginate O-acetyltransferase complex protein AlgI